MNFTEANGGCTLNSEQTTDIGIIGAMRIEVETIWAAMEDKKQQTVSGISFVSGLLGGRRVVAAGCGIGKVFAAICAQTMILRYRPRVLINTGVAGTLTDRLSIGQVALADRVVQHDMDTSPLGDPVGLVSGINQVYLPTDPEVTACLAACVGGLGVPFARGTIASGDQFIADPARKARITSAFEHVIACEMEGAAIGQVCYVNRVPCAILRAISDGGNETACTDYPTFLRAAAGTAASALIRFAQVWRG